MGTRGRKSFQELCAELKERAAGALFEKARVASGVAKVAFARGRAIAYAVKNECIARSMELAPFLFRLRSDLECRRYVVAGRFGALHWKRLNDVG